MLSNHSADDVATARLAPDQCNVLFAAALEQWRVSFNDGHTWAGFLFRDNCKYVLSSVAILAQELKQFRAVTFNLILAVPRAIMTSRVGHTGVIFGLASEKGAPFNGAIANVLRERTDGRYDVSVRAAASGGGALEHVIAVKFDRVNFDWMSQCKTFYGMSPQVVLKSFGGPKSQSTSTEAFRLYVKPPSRDDVLEWWGEDAYVAMLMKTHHDLNNSSKPRQLYWFANMHEVWDCVVFTTSEKHNQTSALTTRHDTLNGKWWPALAARCDSNNTMQVRCQAQCISGSQPWETPANRIHAFVLTQEPAVEQFLETTVTIEEVTTEAAAIVSATASESAAYSIWQARARCDCCSPWHSLGI